MPDPLNSFVFFFSIRALQMIQNQQQRRIGELAQKQLGKPHINPYGTPGMSLNDAGDYRKMVPVDEGVVQQIKQIAFDHMKNGFGVSDGEDVSKVIRGYVSSLAPEQRLSASCYYLSLCFTGVPRYSINTIGK